MSKTPDQHFNDRWKGHSEDDVLLRYGRPGDTVVLSSGNKVDSYHAENNIASSSAAFYQGAGGASSQSHTIYWDRRFEIDSTTLTVVRATITGNGCDYEK